MNYQSLIENFNLPPSQANSIPTSDSLYCWAAQPIGRDS